MAVHSACKTAPLSEDQTVRHIKLLDESDAAEIRKVTSNLAEHSYTIGNTTTVRLPIYIAYQAEGTLKPATKRATCRLCGNKITEGWQLSFFYDEEQNSWTAKEYHVHADGCPTT